MNKNITRPIGEIFKYGKVKLQVVEKKYGKAVSHVKAVSLMAKNVGISTTITQGDVIQNLETTKKA